MRVGYAVAVDEQRALDDQIELLTGSGCERIYTDLLSATHGERPGWKAALLAIGAADTLVVATLSQVGQSQHHLLAVVTTLYERDVRFVSLAEQVEVNRVEGTMVCVNFAALADFAPAEADDGLDRSTVRERRRRRIGLSVAALVGSVLLYVLCYWVHPSYQQYSGRVVSARTLGTHGNQVNESVTVVVTSGQLTGTTTTLDYSYLIASPNSAYARGDHVLLGVNQHPQSFFLAGYDRRAGTFALLLLFYGLILLVAKRQGVMAMLGMAFSVLVVLGFVAPHILRGSDPLLYAIVAALFIIPVTYYLAHGLHRKTTVAVLSTGITLTLSLGLAALFAHLLKLPFEVSADEGTLFYTDNGQFVNAQSLYLAALLIGALAVLNDITIAQASIVTSLVRANPVLGLRALIVHAMEVGKDHVASLINTLLLVYIGASFPLFLSIARSVYYGSFSMSDPSFSADLLRTVIVSIAIVAAVPVSTAIAAVLAVSRRTQM